LVVEHKIGVDGILVVFGASEPVVAVEVLVFKCNHFPSADYVLLPELGHLPVFILEGADLVDVVHGLVDAAHPGQPLLGVHEQEAHEQADHGEQSHAGLDHPLVAAGEPEHAHEEEQSDGLHHVDAADYGVPVAVGHLLLHLEHVDVEERHAGYAQEEDQPEQHLLVVRERNAPTEEREQQVGHELGVGPTLHVGEHCAGRAHHAAQLGGQKHEAHFLVGHDQVGLELRQHIRNDHTGTVVADARHRAGSHEQHLLHPKRKSIFHLIYVMQRMGKQVQGQLRIHNIHFQFVCIFEFQEHRLIQFYFIQSLY